MTLGHKVTESARNVAHTIARAPVAAKDAFGRRLISVGRSMTSEHEEDAPQAQPNPQQSQPYHQQGQPHAQQARPYPQQPQHQGRPYQHQAQPHLQQAQPYPTQDQYYPQPSPPYQQHGNLRQLVKRDLIDFNPKPEETIVSNEGNVINKEEIWMHDK